MQLPWKPWQIPAVLGSQSVFLLLCVLHHSQCPTGSRTAKIKALLKLISIHNYFVGSVLSSPQIKELFQMQLQVSLIKLLFDQRNNPVLAAKAAECSSLKENCSEVGSIQELCVCKETTSLNQCHLQCWCSAAPLLPSYGLVSFSQGIWDWRYSAVKTISVSPLVTSAAAHTNALTRAWVMEKQM